MGKKKLDPSDADEANRAGATYEQFQLTIPNMFRELERIANESKSSAGNLMDAKRKEGWEELVGYSCR